MIVNELLLGGLVHAVKRVERASEVALEIGASLGDLRHDFVALLVGDARSKRDIGQVSADTDTSGFDHSGALLVERRADQGRSIHVGDMGVRWAVLVVVLDNLVEEVGESGVRVGRACIATDARVDVLAA